MADILNTTTMPEIPEAPEMPGTSALIEAIRTTPPALLDAMRTGLEEAIDKLIAFRDLLEPDPDLEDDGDGESEPDDEPNIGWTEQEARWNRYGKVQGDDLEPSLGSCSSGWGYQSQVDWAKGTTDEREDDHDGREPDVDGVPELGSVNRVDQTNWCAGGTSSREKSQALAGRTWKRATGDILRPTSLNRNARTRAPNARTKAPSRTKMGMRSRPSGSVRSMPEA